MIQKGLLHYLNLWVEKFLNFPGCDPKNLMMRKTIWLWTWGGFAATVGITVGILIFDPKLTILVTYGILVMTEIAIFQILAILFPHKYKGLTVFNCCFLLIVTFLFMLKLGGITHSGGLVILGICIVLPTVSLQDVRISGSLFLFYFLTILIAGILNPWLSVPEQMTAKANSIIFMLNTLWAVPYVFLLAYNFISQQKELDQIESKQIRELEETRSKLFTNITHEFRTPLTVIQGMADLISKNPQEWTQPGLEKIKTNSSILLRLVNQMLDLAKIETGAMRIHLVKGDINSYLAYLVELYRSVATSRNIDLKFLPSGIPFEMDFDPQKVMHIISNLISNALKFTEEGGSVEVSSHISDNGNRFGIRVKDTGIGIAYEHQKFLFDRFYQVENNTGNGGTGLGLAVTKEMVELLKGSIAVKSNPETGTEFIIELPVTHNASLFDLNEQKKMLNESSLPFNKNFSSTDDFTSDGMNEFNQHSGIPVKNHCPKLLIVEDNPDVVQYLHTILGGEYTVEMAGNGKSGFEKAREIIPDIILSDVMMPVMDGIEMLEKIKNDILTSHIPVVLLTAKADIDSRLEGLERGADAYLAKPFDEKELHIQLKNLVELRKKLFERYASSEKLIPNSDLNLRKEDYFMGKVRKALESNLEDENFGIGQLCRELAVSRSQLYLKFKSICNKPIADYFKTLRLQKARELLLTTDLNVTEITFTVGFKNLSHFSREFTREFGISPSDFRKNPGHTAHISGS